MPTTIAKIIAAVLLPWIAFELILRLGGYESPDNRTRVLLYPKFPPFYEPDPDLGWKLRPGLDWQGREMVVPFTTDSSGSRTTPGTNSAAVPEVVTVGDSSTFGYGASDAESYPAALAQQLRETQGRPVEVRNLGVPGYTSHSARLIAEANPTPAPVTIVMVGFNDHFPADRSSTQEMWIRRAAYLCFASRACSLLFDKLVPPRAETRVPLVEYQPAVPLPNFESNLIAIARNLKARGSVPIFLIYPSILSDEKTRVAVAAFWKHPRELVDANIDAHPTYQAMTRAVAEREGVRVIDLAAIFDARGNAALHLDWVHPNAAGYRVIAEAVAPAVHEAVGAASGG